MKGQLVVVTRRTRALRAEENEWERVPAGTRGICLGTERWLGREMARVRIEGTVLLVHPAAIRTSDRGMQG